MKADAYGHGIDNLAEIAFRARPDAICLAENAEIRAFHRALERAGVAREALPPIIRIAPATLAEVLEGLRRGWRIEEMVGSLEQARMLSQVALAMRAGGKGDGFSIPVHLHLDTGMGSTGLTDVAKARAVLELPGLEVRGVMTHFSRAYEAHPGNAAEAFTLGQLATFDRMREGLALPEGVIQHVAATAAALKYPETRRDMVRIGSALFGPPFSGVEELYPGRSFRSVLRAIVTTVALVHRNVPPETPVGYETRFVTPPDRYAKLAVLRMGTNDGLPAVLAAREADVLIRGRRFRIVGAISMNVTVVDVSSEDPSDPVREGDRVVFVGRQGDEEIGLAEQAAKAGIQRNDLLLRMSHANPTRMEDPW